MGRGKKSTQNIPQPTAYAPHNTASKYEKQKWTELQDEINKCTFPVVTYCS